MGHKEEYLSKREQQIMQVLVRCGQATAIQIAAELPGNPTKSTVRTLLRIMEERGHIGHIESGGTFVYSATKPKRIAAKAAIEGVLNCFFGGSVRDAVAALLNEKETLTAQEAEELRQLIENARQEERS